MNMNGIAFAPGSRAGAKSGRQRSVAIKAHVVFVVGSETYACPIDGVEHVLRRADAPVQPAAPGSPAWVAGQLVTPNGDVPIISLRVLWGVPGELAPTDRQALLVVRLAGRSFALLVEACLTVLSSLPADTVKFPLPAELRGPRGAAFETAIGWQQSLSVTVQLSHIFSSETQNLLAPAAGGPSNL